MPSASSGPRTTTWEHATLAPIVLIQGTEGLFVDRALTALISQARQADPAVERTTLAAATYQPQMLSVLTSPSLFNEPRLIIIDHCEATTDALITDVPEYLTQPADDVWLILVHRGGVRGKKMLDAVKKAGVPVVQCEPMKKDADKIAFVTKEFQRARRQASADAVRALVGALGGDVRELAAACDQLISDTDGLVTDSVVERYYGGRVEVTGFKVADAAVLGDTAQALTLLRHAMATGADPVPLVAALAMKLRALAKVSGMRQGKTAKDTGLAPWQIDRAKRDLAGWGPDGLAQAICAVAEADEMVKGGGRDPEYAIERAVRIVADLAGRR
ncbi:DNA polymerase III subunit delta [Jonesia denitrificans]|uniref:DNA-directed DNA polymerase n=1 Tax=Jonesia denitrificans (strain ATCC 14870 / DSM 20603 / BCRC 15368 / CIP 55.134 / JCM 11481 / NBRC 15587 / NCTC 10816 / Prevot 55134) TaxID=471856 RepID=C7R538_JONDD|nr:DNA polymerase III subunit delta [Jonesia denitrificans]ACV09208.1 DNA polymerase III, delta subunit [Jonesia denitrificans DSM 20603]ASE09519.1 DNA polymerase III subunit delta [Jonesia denitrificans]QXB44062.1 DNA polymerase III subunit delta [Jonesia denitrificans]SQH21441.1 DNA polymerase III, delta subunit [Jonesia denitrificans]